MAAPRSPRTIDRGSFEQFQTLLKDLPPKPKEKFTIAEVVQELKPFIQSAIAEKGYSPKELVNLLKEQTGKTISARQIKQVLQETAAPAPKRRSYTRKKAAAETATEPTTSVTHVNPQPVSPSPAEATPAVEETQPEEAKPKRTRSSGGGKAASKPATTARKTSSRTTAKQTPAKRTPRTPKKKTS